MSEVIHIVDVYDLGAGARAELDASFVAATATSYVWKDDDVLWVYKIEGQDASALEAVIPASTLSVDTYTIPEGFPCFEAGDYYIRD